jgi:long-chain fatty acid transport protein
MKSITFPTCVAVMTVASITATSYAGGFASAQFGGAHGNAASDSLTSIFYNPAGLALDSGTRAYVEALVADRRASYARAAGDVDDPNAAGATLEANTGAAKLDNLIVSPFAAIASDFGQRGLAVAVGVSVPFGGSADWSKVDKWAGNAQFPGAVDSPARWSIVTGKQQSIFYTGAAAYRTADNRLAFGAGINVIQSAIQLTRARNIDGTDTLDHADGTVAEGRSLLDVSSFDLSIGFGVIAQLDSHTKIGLSYQSQPLGGEQKMDGTITNKFGSAAETAQQVELRQRLPDSVRAGVEWQGSKYAVRGGADWTHWSVYQDQCLIDSTLPSSCQFLPSGAFDPSASGSAPLLEIPRNWGDSWGLQGGGSYWPSHDLELSANLRLDTNAVPDSTLEPALMDANKLIGMLGARYTRGKIVLDLTIADVAYAKRTTEPRSVDPEAPSRNPDMAGIFEQNVAFALVGIGVRN